MSSRYLAMSPFGSFSPRFDAFGSLLDRYLSFSPSSTVQSTEKGAVLTLPVPGFKRNEVNITVEHPNVLLIKGQSPTRGTFEESYQLGDTIDASSIKARLEDGLLTVELSKRALPEARRIEIA